MIKTFKPTTPGRRKMTALVNAARERAMRSS